MENLDPNHLLILVGAIAGLILLSITLYLGTRLGRARVAQQQLNAVHHRLETDLALAQQSRDQTREQYETLSAQGIELQARNQSLLDSLHRAEKHNQALSVELSKDREFHAQRLQQMEQDREQLKLEFENLAGKILDEKAKTLNQNSQHSIEALLKPFREQIEGFQKRVNDVHADAIRGNSLLEGEIKKVLEVGLKMGSDAKNLTSALKGDSQKRGAWGEAQLERTLEMSGLVPGMHFDKQTAFKDASGRRRQTDYLIRLPDGKHLIIDSKVSLLAYDKIVSANSAEMERVALNEHVNSVKQHIDDLSGKDYTNLIGVHSPSFVLLFMPIEPAYIEALKFEKDLFSYGYDRNIVLVSHTTLIPILRTVANLWTMERSHKETREISEKAGDIYNQVCEVATRLQKLGGSLGAASNHYNDTLTALVGRQGLHGKVERFNLLSTKVSKSMPPLEPLHPDLQQANLEFIIEALDDILPLAEESLPEQ